MAYSKTIYIQPTTLTDLTVTLTRNNEVVNTWTLSDFVLGSSDGTNYYLQGTIDNYVRNDILTISSTGYQTQTIDIWRMITDNITLTPLEFSNIETNSIKYYCKDEVARNSITSIATDLNNKAGTDLANVTNTGKVLMSGMGMPSKKALTLTVGASGSNVTMPANGWLIIRGKTSAANQVISIKVSGNSVYHEEERRSYAADNWITILMPVNSGDTVTYYYNINASDIYQFQLIYAQGAESEAS